MLYKTEFPDYDDVLKIPKGFTDCSYHNDVCPHVAMMFTQKDTQVEYDIWQDYTDPEKRENEYYKKYTLHIRINETILFAYSTENWEEIKKLLPHLMVLNYLGWQNALD